MSLLITFGKLRIKHVIVVVLKFLSVFVFVMDVSIVTLADKNLKTKKNYVFYSMGNVIFTDYRTDSVHANFH